MWGHKQQWISYKINIRKPTTIEKISQEPFWSYQLKSTANSAHLSQNQAKLAKSAVLFSWQLQNGSHNFDFFSCHGCPLFILCEIHCFLCLHIFWVYYFSLSQCEIGVQSSAALKFGLSSKLMLFILESVHFQSCFPCWISKFGLGEGGSDSHLHTTTMRCYDVRELNLTWVKWLLN